MLVGNCSMQNARMNMQIAIVAEPRRSQNLLPRRRMKMNMKARDVINLTSPNKPVRKRELETEVYPAEMKMIGE